MKTANTMALLMVLFLGQGCALFFPPPFHNSETEITKDENGTIVKSTSKRTSVGFSYTGDKESAQSWANADATVRSVGKLKLGAQKQPGYKKGESMYKNSQSPNQEKFADEVFDEYAGDVEYLEDTPIKREDVPFLKGLAINKTNDDVVLKFYKDGKRLKKTFSFTSGETAEVVLPSYGTWTAVWRYRGEDFEYVFEVVPGKEVVTGNGNFGWFARLRMS